MPDLHPFWAGVQYELAKCGFIDAAVEHPGIAAGVGAAGLGLGALTVHGLRKTFNEGRPLGVPRPPPPPIKKGFGWKGMAVAGLAGGAASLYGAHKFKQKMEQRRQEA
jgi:hypothetical protein